MLTCDAVVSTVPLATACERARVCTHLAADVFCVLRLAQQRLRDDLHGDSAACFAVARGAHGGKLTMAKLVAKLVALGEAG